MSQVLGPTDPFESYQQPSGTNVLGVVGFILSFCLSPIGLIISLIALAKAPRGFAIAGVIIGLLGSGVWACGGWGYTMMKKIGGMSAFEMTSDFEQIKTVATPTTTDITTLTLAPGVDTDPWGTPYRIGPNADASSFTLSSNGPDKLPDTADDLSLDGKMEPNEAMQSLLEELMRRSGIRTSTTTTTTSTPAPATPPAPKPEAPPADQPAGN